MNNKIIVAGGGASGLVAAIYAARKGADVTILEHRDRVGKKILMTGNGKCNMTNMGEFEGKYYSSDKESLNKIYKTLERFNATDTRNFFAGLGLCTKEKRDGGVYPVSEQALVVVDVLKSECERLNIKIETDCEVKSIKDGEVKYIRYIREAAQGNKNKTVISEFSESVKYDKLILAMGGKAAKVSGSDGSGYYFAKSIGHTIIEPLPALVQLKCDGDYFKSVSGVRAQVELGLYIDGKFTASEEGELQLTDYGISGIPVFQISRLASRALYEGRKCMVKINFVPFISELRNEVKDIKLKQFSHKSVEDLISGLVHKKLAKMICKKNNITPTAKVGETDFDKILSCIRELADFEVTVAEANSFENAQVCSGGVPLGEVDDNFKSMKDENVYIVGELLDCDGVCGGYNLQWAWATGAIAGMSAGKDINDNN
jgi:hypothetical protein